MIGTPHSNGALRAMLLGCGELGKEVAIELQRMGVEVIGVDRYPNAPAMQVAHRFHVIDMLDGNALKAIIKQEQPHLVIPEIEAIATQILIEMEAEGVNIIPTAKATQLTMDREGIRRFAAETLNLPTSPYVFCDTQTEFELAIEKIGIPCMVKPVMSSSGKGQSVIREANQILTAWQYAQEGGRAGGGRVIVEGFVPFDYEITLLTISSINGIHFCDPIGHRQEDGDYRESWQPQAMPASVLKRSQEIGRKVVEALGGYGLFGVELFIKGDEVYFSEVSPRPHDTGMVTLISQDLSEFALHARAILGLPIANITQHGPSASAVILGSGQSDNIRFEGICKALEQTDTQLRLFGKPEINGHRRLGVALARGSSIDNAIEKALHSASVIKVIL
ncbi:formate-dependent phosphoribosylglycinamide formyltransferase [Shewanella sp. D64]|uniref:formate-dependent phosphoribosylglycinamide formyltransferase n=1 Tax=unclassified Shewanella TaxID=196818 RepID=UPI0022BA299B|nr:MULTISPECIES: formate-dependent phosphoribosylglycinamide formyltransferase [unclassified Shewanella]MEC4727280.1 formate-dependent phosphoribosylglycinamide formyltransferase [Shewanella sp. D64]MEC4739435.1 formate-dependent phosphoribosylglycinamide formyltransferase [Shewanella sp. E94]WBJ96764.1 formate-dependent phosphoribosylglycinamide formyltransferase [Shewanella sp. MTB7]